MPKNRVWTALGLMSGTSLDGVDAAIIRTDGEKLVDFGPSMTVSYAPDMRSLLRHAIADAAALGAQGVRRPVTDIIRDAELAITDIHVDIVDNLLKQNDLTIDNIDIIGFHGQTILHRPEDRLTWQIGDGQRLARLTGIEVVCDFRSNDVAAGGQGAPLAPLYHRALAASDAPGITAPQTFPVVVLNLGGVANVTWLGAPGSDRDGDILAFDTGPGNALIDDWVRTRSGAAFDRGGALAARGEADPKVLEDLLDHPYFSKTPPKSLDRNSFQGRLVERLGDADGAATLTEFTAASVGLAGRFYPAPAALCVVCGGGRHNRAMIAALRRRLGCEVVPAEALGWRGDALEAELFGFLAVRSLRGMVLGLPTTTGADVAQTGGRLFRP